MVNGLNKALSILIADDHAIVREGLRAIINRQPDMVVAGEASNGEQAVGLFKQLRPSVTLMDLRMPLLDGLEATTRICQEFPNSRIIILMDRAVNEDVRRALKAGAQSFLLKDAPPEALLKAIRAVHKGQRHIPPSVTELLADGVSQTQLTVREMEVLRLIAAGKSNKRIADALNITEGTVKVHLKNILSKLYANDRTQAVIAALKRGLINLD